jgi:hypothetical protein
MAVIEAINDEYCLVECGAIYFGKVHLRFQGKNCKHLQGQRVSQARIQ